MQGGFTGNGRRVIHFTPPGGLNQQWNDFTPPGGLNQQWNVIQTGATGGGTPT